MTDLLTFLLPYLLPDGCQVSISVEDRIISLIKAGKIQFAKRLTPTELHLLLPLIASPQECPYEVLIACTRYPEEAFYHCFLPFIRQQTEHARPVLDFYAIEQLIPWLVKAYNDLQFASELGSQKWEHEMAPLREAIRKINKEKLVHFHLQIRSLRKSAYTLMKRKSVLSPAYHVPETITCV